jgi:hypothetical protein
MSEEQQINKDEISVSWTVKEKEAVLSEIMQLRLEQLEGGLTITEAPTLTNNTEINNQLIKYFWYLTLLSFGSQLITYVTQLISGVITGIIFWILAFGAVNTLLIGGAVKMVQKQMEAVATQNNTTQQKNTDLKASLATAQDEISALKQQLNQRDAELIAAKIKQNE